MKQNNRSVYFHLDPLLDNDSSSAASHTTSTRVILKSTASRPPIGLVTIRASTYRPLINTFSRSHTRSFPAASLANSFFLHTPSASFPLLLTHSPVIHTIHHDHNIPATLICLTLFSLGIQPHTHLNLRTTGHSFGTRDAAPGAMLHLPLYPSVTSGINLQLIWDLKS